MMQNSLLRPRFCLLSAVLLLSLTGASAFAEQPHQKSEPAQAEAPERWNIQIENWTKPQPGWLYILDPKPDTSSSGGRVWLFDPDSGKAMGSIRTGDHPDFALSPDGSRLYVASSTEGDSGELAVIDTAEGVILKSGSVGGRAVSDGLPPFSTMAVSGDGLALRILIVTPKSEDADSFLLATFDTRQGEFLPGIVHLGNCGPGRFISYPTADQFDFFCPRTNRIRLIRVDSDSRETQNIDIMLPWERREGVAQAMQIPGSQTISIVRGDGGVFEMNSSRQFADTLTHPGLPNRVPPAAWPISPDGNRLFLGYNHDYDRQPDNRFYLDYGRAPNLRPSSAMTWEFRVLDTRKWRKIGTIKTKAPFWSAAIASDGKTLYALAPEKHMILVLDTEKMRQVRALPIAGTPALAIVVPDKRP
jgi:hypothetical protein